MKLKKLVKWVAIMVGGMFALLTCYFYFHLDFTAATMLPPYSVATRHDDTLRVVMIGDSWAMFHESLHADSVLEAMLRERLNVPVKVRSRGKGGANSKEIYYYMFASKTVESEQEPDKCTQPLLEEHPDYCLISAGINDAAQGKGASFLCQNYENILSLLLFNHIRPVVLELPTVLMGRNTHIPFEDFFNANRSYAMRKLRERIDFRVMAFVKGATLDDVTEYREEMKQMLLRTGLTDSVLYISIADWNPDGYEDSRNIYIEDGTHLNLRGYHVLDSCYAETIARDYKNKHQ